MSDPNSDEDLAALFARRRAAEDERVPDYQTMRTRALSKTGTAGSGGSKARDLSTRPGLAVMWRWAIPAMAIVLLGLAIVLVGQHRSPTPTAAREEVVREIARIDVALQADLAKQSALTAWQSPTDFLLQSIPSKTP